jgi:DNA-binding HxlR family transcriptional regulator
MPPSKPRAADAAHGTSTVKTLHTPDPSREKEHEGIHFVLKLLRHRWTVPVLQYLCLAPTHFTDLHRRLGVSRKVLTGVLREMERDGLVERHEPEKVGSKGSYGLTERGIALRPKLEGLAHWATEYAVEVETARRRFAKQARPQRGVTRS